jgi:hypothetical protein
MIQHANWLKNRLTTWDLEGKTPFEILNSCKPDLGDVPAFGVQVWVKIESVDKLGPQRYTGRWVSYDRNSLGHVIYVPDKRKIVVERNMQFDHAADMKGDKIEGEKSNEAHQELKNDLAMSLRLTKKMMMNCMLQSRGPVLTCYMVLNASSAYLYNQRSTFILNVP